MDSNYRNKENSSSDNVNEPNMIVGIVIASDQVESFLQFLELMPPDSGLVYMITTYQNTPIIPLSHDILSQHTSMPIINALHKVQLNVDHIYIIPPDRDIVIDDGQLSLVDVQPLDQNLPMDRLFCSLINYSKRFVIGILFVGESVDNALGIETIRQANGIIIQHSNEIAATSTNEESNHYRNDQSDYIISAKNMPKLIYEIIQYNISNPSIEDDRVALFALLNQTTGIDFTYYKKASIYRRIQRRMAINGFNQLRDYNKFLEDKPKEINALQKDLLIGVTQFFRDPDAFQTITKKVLPVLFEQRKEEKQIRVWVAGCSTGEEVYSLAILLKEYMDSRKLQYDIKIFATDLDKESILIASKGAYSDNIKKSVTPHHLKTYFTRQINHKGYQVSKEIRQMIVFAQHNILRDPPFTQLDIISCRNMLIYLQLEMQQKVLSLFHFALKRDAFLVLGPSETLGKLSSMFKVIDRKWNVYQYKKMNQWLTTTPFGMPSQIIENKSAHKNKAITRLNQTERMITLENIYTKLIEEYVTTFIIIDENNEIIHINGDVSDYLLIPKGRPSHNLFKMIPEYMSVVVKTLLHKVRREGEELTYPNLDLGKDKDNKNLTITIKPFVLNSTDDKLTIIFFNEDSQRVTSMAPQEFNGEEKLVLNLDHTITQQIKDLENELFLAKETLQSTIDELESSNEEFQATNEELIVANEELQSTNEELQSVNEELQAVNNEYQFKIQELTELNNDITNFFVSTNIATIFLDIHMNIRKFTPAVTKVINLIELDTGRPIRDISHQLKYEHLVSDAENVLHTNLELEKEIQSKDGKWYSIKMLPYRTMDNRNEGVVITLIEITESKKASEELLILSYSIQQSPGCILITDLDRKIKYINTKYTEQTGFLIDDLMDSTLELHSDLLDENKIKDIWNQVNLGSKWVGELTNNKKNGESFSEMVSLLPILSKQGEILHYLRISEDMTDQKNTLEMLHKSEMLSAVGQLAAGIAHEIRNPLTALKGFTKLLDRNTDKKNYTQIMLAELDRIETIISELLVLARPQKLNFEKYDVIQILNDVIVLLDPQALLNNVEIVTKIAHEIPPIICIQNQLKQVFINLIKNGIEAMPHGGDLIIKVRMTENNDIWMSFTDHGVGIAEDKIAKLGSPFYTTKDDGTGLGLMVSYKIIENHQGSMDIRSVLGKGSTVDVILRCERRKSLSN
jgi:two-component system CheB/CheR fusion protein